MENIKDESYKTVINLYRTGNDIESIRLKTGINHQKVRRILITEGLYENEISIKIKKLTEAGKKPAEIAKILNISYAAVNSYIPYEKGIYKSSTPTLNAQRVQKCREQQGGAYRKPSPDYRVLVPAQPEKKLMDDDYISKRTINYKVSGDQALFLDGGFRVAGEQYSYVIPTYQALVGITESIYWNSDIKWVIDKIRIMHKLQLQIPETNHNGKILQSAYLRQVEYNVQAHFEWADTCRYRNYGKHMDMIKRYLSKGGRRNIYLGAEECQGKVEPCEFDAGIGYYDNSGEIMFDLMLHSMGEYDNGKPTKVYFWQPKMTNGVIILPRTENCKIFRTLPGNKI